MSKNGFVAVIAGRDTFMVGEKLDALVAEIGADPCDIEQIVATAGKFDSWMATASTAPFLSDVRVIVVRHVARISLEESTGAPSKEAPDVLKRAFKALPESAAVLLCLDEEYGEDDRAQRPVAVRNWLDAIKSAGGKVFDVVADPAAVAEECRRRANAKGKKLSTSAATLLSEMTGGKMGLALGELDKLVLFAGDADEVTATMVRKVVTPESDYNIFRLADSVFEGDQAKGLAELRALRARFPRLEEQVIGRILPVMLAQVRAVWQARALIEAGVDPMRPAAAPDGLLPDKSIAKDPEWKLRRIARFARHVGFDSLTDMFGVLAKLDADFKGAVDAELRSEALEQALFELCRLARVDQQVA